MTVVVILLLTKISVKEEIKVREAVGGININAATTSTSAAEGSGVMTDLEDEAHGITGRGDLWFIFGRFVTTLRRYSRLVLMIVCSL